MAQCNIEGALKFIEELYKKAPSKGKAEVGKQALKEIFETVNSQRALLQEASTFAGAKTLNINKPFAVVDFTPTARPVVKKAETKEASTPLVKTRKFGGVTAYFYPKGAKELKGALAFTRYDDKGEAFIVMQEGIKKQQVLDYLAGKDNTETSIQKSVVNNFMMDVYGVDLVGELSKMDDSSIRQFIIKHELSHINNVDKSDVYYADKTQSIAKAFGSENENNKYLADSAIRIETRANIEALENSLKDLITPDYTKLEEVAPIESTLNPLVEDVEDTPPWDVEEETQEATKPNTPTSYKVTGNMKTNEGQTYAINTMISWFKENKSDTFLLQGRGGTGKTTVINVLLRELGVNPSEVTFATPTNKAKKVLSEANSKTAYSGSSYYTVAQLLGIKPEMDNQGNQTFKEDMYADKPSIGKVLVIDEASMLHSQNYEALLARAEEQKAKVIFMGDNAQLPPIGDKKGQIKSVVFEDNANSTVALTQLMRQGEESPIIKMTSGLIKLVDKVEGFLGQGGDKAQAKTQLRKVLFDSVKFGKFNKDTNEGVVLTNSSFDELLPGFLKDFKQSPKGTKYINFNNYSHTYTVQKTNKIREALYGERASSEMFIPGEPLMLNAPYILNVELGNDATILDNGEEFTVVSSTVKKKKLPYRVGNKTIITEEAMEVYEIVAKDNVTGMSYTFNKPVGNKQEVKEFIEREKSNTAKNGVKPGGAYMLTSVLAEGLAHGYIINSHRSQGSTYDNVYMDLGNIAGQAYSEANDIVKSLYVAASRPRKKLVVVDTRDSGNQLVNPSKAAVAEARPAAFENVDNAEANDIIKKIDDCNSKGE